MRIDDRGSQSASLLRYGLAFGIGILVSIHTYHIYREFAPRADWLYWDPAAHAFYGVRIAESLLHFHPVDFLHTLNEQTLWPPLHSLLQLPFQIAFGPGFSAAALCSFAFLALIFPALTLVNQKVNYSWSAWAAVMTLAATSPIYAGYGSMPMLEIFGAVFTMISAGLYLRKSRWFPLSLTFLFFLKYNYCIYVLLAVGVLQLLSRRSPGGSATRPYGQLLKTVGVFGWFVIVYLAALALILITGGFRIGKLSVHGIGNPLYALLLIVVIRAFITGQHKTVWRKIRGTGWEWFVIPVLIWLIIPVPNRVKTLVSFAINSPLGGQKPAELAYYTFYFHALTAYFSHPAVAWSCLAGAVITAILFRQRREILFLALLFALPFLLMTFNQNKQERFLFTFIFPLWILIGEGINRIPQVILRWAASLAVIAACLYFYDIRAVRDVVAWPFVPSSVEPQVREIAQQAAPVLEVRILGTRNDISPALLSYHIMKITGYDRMPHIDWELERNPPQGTLILRIQP